MAQSLSDLLVRRTDVAVRGVFSEAMIEWAAGMMAAELGWSNARKRDEAARLHEFIGRHRGGVGPKAFAEEAG